MTSGARSLVTLAAVAIVAAALRPRGGVRIVNIPECEPLRHQVVLREYPGGASDGGS
jgi:hypothetical protein